MFFRQIGDDKLAQYAYLIGCQVTGEALVIDPERDIDRYVEMAEEEGLRVTAVTETHIHADYLSGAREFAERYGVRLYLSDEGDADWKYGWVDDGDYDYALLKDGDRFRIGNIEIQAVHTPGHTPEHMSFLVTDHGGGADAPMGIATGDFVFVGDLGRPDLLESAAGQAGAREPSARRLHASVKDFLDLPDYLQVWPGHGAGSACGKALGAVPETTVGYERRFNSAIAAAVQGEDVFVSSILSGQPEPPLYFARMKRDNKRGPKVLGAMPAPEALDVDALAALAGRTDVAVVDARRDRAAFTAAHLPGALHAPLDRAFNTIVGTYVDEDAPIYLVVDADDVAEAVRDLVRIGLDDVAGYATPETFARYVEAGGAVEAVETVTFDALAPRYARGEVQVLDVRGAAEYEAARIPGAQNVAYTRLIPRMDELATDRPLAVHCVSGRRAAAAAALLQRYGFEVVLVDDDFGRWAEIGDVAAGPAVAAVAA